jgi:hypothetical protein
LVAGVKGAVALGGSGRNALWVVIHCYRDRKQTDKHCGHGEGRAESQ